MASEGQWDGQRDSGRLGQCDHGACCCWCWCGCCGCCWCFVCFVLLLLLLLLLLGTAAAAAAVVAITAAAAAAAATIAAAAHLLQVGPDESWLSGLLPPLLIVRHVPSQRAGLSLGGRPAIQHPRVEGPPTRRIPLYVGHPHQVQFYVYMYMYIYICLGNGEKSRGKAYSNENVEFARPRGLSLTFYALPLSSMSPTLTPIPFPHLTGMPVDRCVWGAGLGPFS